MKKNLAISLLFVALFVVSAFGQVTPNCNLLNQSITSATSGSSYQNTFLKCSIWKLNYFSEGFSALSIQLEGAPDNNGAPGTWALISTTITNGTNPMTNTVSGSLSINAYFPWMRANVTAVTGSGTINYSMIGNAYVGDSSSSSSGGGVASNVNIQQYGGAATTLGQKTMANSVPVVVASDQSTIPVVGNVAAGGVPSGNPVAISGTDGAQTRRVLTDTGGRLIVESQPGVPDVFCVGTRVAAALQAVPTSSTLISWTGGASNVTTCVSFLVINNTTSGALTISITDNQGSPVSFLTSFSIPASSQLLQPLYGLPFTSGVKWQASGSGLTGGGVAVQ